ncbi:MAG: hypothetical protein K0S30_961 [Clostridia bacterium]|nr:hypothetical protein [Clostridia bacterium]
MKKWYRIIIIGILLMIIGIVLIGMGMMRGGKTQIEMGNPANRGDSIAVKETLEAFDELEIDVDTVEFKLVKGENYGIDFVVSDRAPVEYHLTDGKLTVKQKGYKKLPINISLGFNFSNKMVSGPSHDYITLSVPEEANLQSIMMKCGVGELKISEIETEYLDLDIGVGSFNLSDITAKKAKIKGGVGEISARDFIAGQLDVEVGVGEVDIEGIFDGDVIIKGGMGDIKLRAKGTEKDFNYQFEQGLGEIELNNKSVHSIKQTDNKADKMLSAESGIGSVSIYIEE